MLYHDPPTCMNVQFMECAAHLCLQNSLQQSCSGLNKKKQEMGGGGGQGDE